VERLSKLMDVNHARGCSCEDCPLSGSRFSLQAKLRWFYHGSASPSLEAVPGFVMLVTSLASRVVRFEIHDKRRLRLGNSISTHVENAVGFAVKFVQRR